MKLLRSLLLVSFVLARTLVAQTPSDQSAAVLQAERDGCVAYLRGDADKIATFLTEDYTLTNSKGEISTAADDIQEAKTGKVKYDVFENYDMKVRVYGDTTAVVLGKTKIKGSMEGKSIDIVAQFTDTFVKKNGQWQLAAGHVSRLKN